MPSSLPVVEIASSQWSPYSTSHRKGSVVSGTSNSTSTNTSNTKINSNNSLRQRSSSPIFVSASKLVKQNGTSSHHQKGATTTKKHVASASSVRDSTNLASPFSQTILADVEYDGGENKIIKKNQTNEYVWPPINEPCLRSIFDDEHENSCVWSPTHRIARTIEAVTCQWIVSDEGFGDIVRCEKVFTTTESMAKHVLYAHCKPPKNTHDDDETQIQMPCNWGFCHFKRFGPDRLREHVLEHLRPIAFACPFEQCRMSINSIIGSAEALESHIQTYHLNGEPLRPLATPRPLKELFKAAPPSLPKKVPRFMINNMPIGIPPDAKRRLPDLSSPEPKAAPGTIQPWDQVWRELNMMEPAAIPISPSMLATLNTSKDPPTIRIAAVPAAVTLPLQPSSSSISVEVDMPKPDRETNFIDLTESDVSIYPPISAPRYRPAVDMMTAAPAKRKAKAQYRDRLLGVGVDDDDDDDDEDEDDDEESSSTDDSEKEREESSDDAMESDDAIPHINGLLGKSHGRDENEPSSNAIAEEMRERKRRRLENESSGQDSAVAIM